jgi:hypothetical protein
MEKSPHPQPLSEYVEGGKTVNDFICYKLPLYVLGEGKKG